MTSACVRIFAIGCDKEKYKSRNHTIQEIFSDDIIMLCINIVHPSSQVVLVKKKPPTLPGYVHARQASSK